MATATHTHTRRAQSWSILRVLCWQATRCMRGSTILVLLGILLTPWVLFRGILNVPIGDFEATDYYPAYYALIVFIGMACSYEMQKGVRALLSTRPLTSEFMFAWLLGIHVMTVAMFFVVANSLITVVYAVDWPWGRPLLWLAFIASFARCAYWRVMIGRPWEVFAAIFGGVCIIFCFAAAQGGQRIELDRPFTGLEILLLSIGTCASVVVGYRSFRTVRTDGGDISSDVKFAQATGCADSALIELTAGREAKTQDQTLVSFGSKQAALDWLTWRLVGGSVLTIAIVAGALGIAVQVAATVDYRTFPPQLTAPGKLFEVSVVMFVMACFVAGFGIGLIMALILRTPGELRQRTMSDFHGVRPISNKELYRVLGRATFRYCVMSWLFVLALLSILPLIALVTEDQVPDGVRIFWGTFSSGFRSNAFYKLLGPFSLAAWLLYGFLVTWTFASMTSTVLFFGRDRIVAGLIAVLFGAFIVALFVGLAYPSHLWLIQSTTWTVVGLLAVGLTVWVFRIAWRDRLIGGRHVMGGLFAWSLLAILVANVVPAAFVVGAVMLSTLAAFGVAAGPVGLTASRCR